MRNRAIRIATAAFAICGLAAIGVSETASSSIRPSARLCERVWVWGNPEMADAGTHSVDSFANAGPAERARLLGVQNIIMAGHGLPREMAQAESLTNDVAQATRLVWEISGDSDEAPFEFGETVARVAALKRNHPRLEGVLLDDMTTRMIDEGFTPEHIRVLHDQLQNSCPGIDLWGVVYTMNLDQPHIEEYVHELDVVNLWVWHARDLVNLDTYVTRIEQMAPQKPIVLGLYLYDYGENRRMPHELLELQCATALGLLQSDRIRDVVFLTINNDPGAVSFAAEWIRAHDTLGASRLSMRDLGAWRMSHEGWGESEDGLIRPPDARNLHSRAFHVANSYEDFEVEFEFNGSYRETGTGCAGLIVRASDPNCFYYVYFPWGGQQLRAKHFWAALAKTDGDGYWRNLAMEWVPGVPSETDRWYRVRVAAKGPEIRVWVDGREALTVRDESYGAGFIGLAGYGWYSFRNIVVRAGPLQPLAWDMPVTIPSHAFSVGLSSEEMPSACIAPNGDVLIAAGNRLVRSTDKGRTWLQPETLPDTLGKVTDYGSAMYCATADRVSVMLYTSDGDEPGRAPSIAMAESTDNARTWSDPVPCEVAAGWPVMPGTLTPYGPVVKQDEHTLLRFLLGGVKEEGSTYADVRTWGAVRAKAYVIRSADGGRTWSAPIEIDRPRWTDAERGTIPGSLDLTEPSGVVIGDTVMALVRPIYSPYMWQCWSYDGGLTWDAAARTTFPGYAQSMARTASGAIVCAHRYPLYSINVSRDGGLNWDAGTVIDFPVWAMGAMIEVEPDVVLCTYMNAERNQPLVAQLVRIQPNRIEPVAVSAANTPGG